MDVFFTGLSLGFFLSFMIGPVFFILLETSLTKGIRSALFFDLGVILADVCFIAIAYFSSFQLINKIKDEPSLFIFGGAIMSAFGVISLMQINRLKRSEIHVESTSYQQNYFKLVGKGFLLNFINVGVLGFWFLVILTIGPQLDMEPNRMLCFFVFVITGYFFTDLVKILLAKQLRQKLTPKNITLVKKISYIILIVFGIVIMSKSVIKTDSGFITDKVKLEINKKK